MGLVNTLNDAKAEDALARRDALLDELRTLAGTHADDAAVREQLAMGLVNTLVEAKAEDAPARRDALLDELRALARTYPDDAAVRQRLASGLYGALELEQAKVDRRDSLLGELHALAHSYKDDDAVALRLAWGLVIKLNEIRAGAVLHRLGLAKRVGFTKTEEALARDDAALLEELRGLARTHPNDAAIRDFVGNLEKVSGPPPAGSP